jgi:hypothetical protein
MEYIESFILKILKILYGQIMLFTDEKFRFLRVSPL